MKKLGIVLLIAIMFAGCTESVPQESTPTVKVFEYENIKATIPYKTAVAEHEDGVILVFQTSTIGIESRLESNGHEDTFNGYPSLTLIRGFTTDDRPYKNTTVETSKGFINLLLVYGEGRLAEMFEETFEVVE